MLRQKVLVPLRVSSKSWQRLRPQKRPKLRTPVVLVPTQLRETRTNRKSLSKLKEQTVLLELVELKERRPNRLLRSKSRSSSKSLRHLLPQ
jgi:hypothetical protein